MHAFFILFYRWNNVPTDNDDDNNNTSNNMTVCVIVL